MDFMSTNSQLAALPLYSPTFSFDAVEWFQSS